MHLLAVLPGAALMLGAALRIAAGAELGQGILSTVHSRFLLGGLLLTSAPETVPLLGETLTALTGSAFEGLASVTSAVVVAAVIAIVLPHGPKEYRALVFAPEAGRAVGV